MRIKHQHITFILKSWLNLHMNMQMKDLGPLSYFFGVTASYYASLLFLCQKKHIMQVLYVMLKTCSHSHRYKWKLSTDNEQSYSNHTLYRCFVGPLQYLTFTWPDISYLVQYICFHMHSHRDSHIVAKVCNTLYSKPSLL